MSIGINRSSRNSSLSHQLLHMMSFAEIVAAFLPEGSEAVDLM